jgi:chromate transporter
VDGTPGAIAGWLAMITPALLVVPLIKYAGPRSEHPRVRGMIQMVVFASAGLLCSAAWPLAQSAVVSKFDVALLVVSVGILLTRKVESFWVIFAAALVTLVQTIL